MMRIKIVDPLTYFSTEKLKEKIIEHYYPPNFPFFFTYHSLQTLFAYIVKKENILGEIAMVKIGRILHVERILLDEGENELESILSLINTFATNYLKAQEVRYYVLKEVSGDIFFPGSNTVIGSLIPTKYYPLFKKKQFLEIDCRIGYQIKSLKDVADVDTSDINLSIGMEPKRYYEFHGIPNYPVNFIHEVYGKLLSPNFFVLKAAFKNRDIALFHWYPNYYRLLKDNPMILFSDMNENQISEIIQRLKEAKIFKILFHPNILGKIDLRIVLATIKAVLDFLHEQFGIKHIQIGNFNPFTESYLTSALQELGMTPIYEFRTFSWCTGGVCDG